MADGDFEEAFGTVETSRHDVVRWRYGQESGDDLLEPDTSHDGLTLTIECGSRADADAMLAAIAKT